MSDVALFVEVTGPDTTSNRPPRPRGILGLIKLSCGYLRMAVFRSARCGAEPRSASLGRWACVGCLVSPDSADVPAFGRAFVTKMRKREGYQTKFCV